MPRRIRAVWGVLVALAFGVGVAACGGPRDKEPDPEPGLGPLVASKPLVCEGHTEFVTSVVVSPDGRLVVSGSNDETLRYWDAKDGRLIRIAEVPAVGEESKYAEALAFSPDGKTLVACRSGRTLLFYDAATGRAAPERCPVREGGHGADFLPDGTKLAVASGYDGVRVWGFAKGDRLLDFPIPRPRGNPGGQAYRVAFTPDGKHLAAKIWHSGDGSLKSPEPPLRVWDVTTGTCVFSAVDVGYRAVAFSPGGRLLASDGEDGEVEVYDWAKKKRVTRFRADPSVVFCLAFSPDGRAIFTGGSGNAPDVKRWDAATGKAAGVLKGHTDQVKGIAFSKDGTVLATAGRDKKVLIWHLGTE